MTTPNHFRADATIHHLGSHCGVVEVRILKRNESGEYRLSPGGFAVELSSVSKVIDALRWAVEVAEDYGVFDPDGGTD